MGIRWVIPVICYGLLITTELLAIGPTLLPHTSVFSFVGLHVFAPAFLFILALFLGATGTHLLPKLFFPVVALVVAPLGYLFHGLQRNPELDLRYLSMDVVFALIFTFVPTVLGLLVGLILFRFGKRHYQQVQEEKRARQTRLAQQRQQTRLSVGHSARGGGAEGGGGSGAGGGGGARAGAGGNASARTGAGRPKLRVLPRK
jgi:uncharacterized membrane protein YgcG